MRGAVLHGPGDVRFEERDAPRIIDATDAVIRMSATCVCGSDLWPYRGIQAIDQPTPINALDPNFNLETHFYEREVTFKIPLTVATSVKSKQPVLSIDVLYQTCNDTTCLPPTVAHVTAEVKQ